LSKTVYHVLLEQHGLADVRVAAPQGNYDVIPPTANWPAPKSSWWMKSIASSA